MRDHYFWAACGAAFVFWGGLYAWSGIAPGYSWPLDDPLLYFRFVLLYPLLEEIVFRGLVQDELAKRFTRRFGGLTIANLVTSLVFVGVHFFYHAPIWAAVIILPSLLFGYFKERHGALLSPILLHVFYNAGYYLLFFRPIT